MAFYQQTRTAKAAAIGTIMPWTGGVSNIPKGWIICDGSGISASAYPLLARAIGDTYNNGPSSFSGSFPAYLGSIVLPNLSNKNLLDMEQSYFGPTGTGSSVDSDPGAVTVISPLIGTNTDNGIKTIYNDITTDVIFTLNDRSGYSGKATGNILSGGDGETKTVYLGPRKLGRDHIKSHNHPGLYESISTTDPVKPGIGVIPYSNFQYEFVSRVSFSDNDIFVGSDRDSTVRVSVNIVDGQSFNKTGFSNNAPAGRVVAGIDGDNPPENWIPFGVGLTPIRPFLTNPRVETGAPIPYASGGNTISLTGSNYYSYSGNPLPIDQANTFDTLLTPSAKNPEQIIQTPGTDDVIVAHTHDEFDVEFVRGSLRPNASLTIDVEAPNANLSLDNASNRGALQINFNTTQPALTCIYIIRAY
jgi:hypothetical protein